MIQKIPRKRDHGNSTMTQDQRVWVQQQIFNEYKQCSILNTKVLKARIIYYANQYQTHFGKGKGVFEMKKSTFYDFLRIASIPLPKNYYRKATKAHENQDIFITKNSHKELKDIKIEGESEIEIHKNPEMFQGKETSEINKREIGTQTDNFNLFMSVLTLNGWVLLPLQR